MIYMYIGRSRPVNRCLLFLDQSQYIRTTLEEKNSEMKLTTRKTKREEMEKVYGPSKLRILHSKN